jgi:hypothetical protein
MAILEMLPMSGLTSASPLSAVPDLPVPVIAYIDGSNAFDLNAVVATFTETALAGKLALVTGRRVVKVVIHPGELEEWARRKGRAASDRVRSDFAGTLWRTENAYVADPDFRVRTGANLPAVDVTAAVSETQ